MALLEDRLGKRLFRKSGRRLELTDDGRVALRYADEIFNLGSELELPCIAVAELSLPICLLSLWLTEKPFQLFRGDGGRVYA